MSTSKASKRGELHVGFHELAILYVVVGIFNPRPMNDMLTVFSPLSDFLPVATADGTGKAYISWFFPVQTWDVGSGHLRREFVDGAVSASGAGTASDDGSGHLAVDYSCITWNPLFWVRRRS